MPDLSKNEPCPLCGRFANRGVSIDAVIIKNNQVLLIQRGVDPDKGLWGTPGGYVDWDETIEEAVHREVKEETGLNVVSTVPVGVYSSPSRHRQVINNVFIVEVEDSEPISGDDAQAVRWCPLSELPEVMALDHKQNIVDALKFLSK